MKNGKKIDGLKALGIGAMLLGLAANLFAGFVDEKKTDAKIDEKVKKAVASALTNEDC